MSESFLRQSERVYALLVRCYPAGCRGEFGVEMQAVFSDCLRDAYQTGGGRGILRLWGRTALDAGASLALQHIETLLEGVPMLKKNLLRLALVTALILLIPLVAMQFTSEVNWGPGDFVVAAGLLGMTAIALELAARAGISRGAKLLAAGAILFALLVVWAELAVGLFH